MENQVARKLIVTMYAESQLHAGKGMDVGIVDLPIQRERTTAFPIIQGVKGALRANLKLDNEEEIFGSDNTKSQGDETKPGKVAFSEAKILLFPVRHIEKLFVWVTSPLALIRFLKELENKRELIKKLETLKIAEDEAIVLQEAGEILLEDFQFKTKQDDVVKEIAEIITRNVATVDYIKKKLETDIVIVDDNRFSAICQMMTEVIPRIAIDKQTGTVKSGALWYEEYLPQDTVMYFVARETIFSNKNPNDQILETLQKAIDRAVITIGGKETVGKGLVALKVVNEQ
ncbi:type III-B CRISPR module RAMP protein Cmr4 [Fervidobacterium riparium]|uniref:CRISPR-associated protein Cmr4 n=1 Tax=Fervidobacterium gondwanense DSM 13020 TaxID=1121883 RepID=A0A1M7TGE1_FERGO|nr:type III-B CRISPR module RAMP protein Cmr4 [Fervidobacterium gondwanense]UXF00257.1 CRISPR-associated protein Cmr4 [Fervidobacterium riparium]SHN69812.1 CRISPR-associated protein Cmr4 [Fervidobacterium gondwanense DSM 13020]